MSMFELDLHGIKHIIARQLLEKTINRLWGTNQDLHIITGHSNSMKKIVIDLLTEYKLEYTIGDFSGQNTGFIRTYLD